MECVVAGASCRALNCKVSNNPVLGRQEVETQSADFSSRKGPCIKPRNCPRPHKSTWFQSYGACENGSVAFETRWVIHSGHWVQFVDCQAGFSLKRTTPANIDVLEVVPLEFRARWSDSESRRSQ